MAFDVTPKNLYREVKAAVEWHGKHLKSYKRQLREYHGQHYKATGGQSSNTDADGRTDHRLEGTAFSWVAQVLGRLVYANPKTTVSTRRPQEQAKSARLLEHALNRWVRDHDFQGKFEELVRDMQFNYGVALVTSEPVPGQSPTEYIEGVDGGRVKADKGVPHAPALYRLSQNWFFEDPLAISRDGLRFQGHFVTRDKDDLLYEAEEHPDRGWNVDAIEALATDQEPDGGEGMRPKMGGDQARDEVERGQVFFAEVWVPDRQLDGYSVEDGFHGTIYTIALDPLIEPGLAEELGEGVIPDPDGGKYAKGYLREPRPFYGPASGPYCVGAIYSVPDDPVPLGPLTATQGAQDELNAVSAANTRSAKTYKRMVLVDTSADGDNKLVNRIKSSPHDTVYGVKGLEKNRVVPLEVGGLSDQGMAQELRMEEKVHSALGLSDALRGNVTGKGTASENILAAQSAQSRMGFIEMKVDRFATAILKKVAEIMWMDNKVLIPLGPDAAEDLGMLPIPAVDNEGLPIMDEVGRPLMIQRQPAFRGGASEDEGSFADLEIEIVPKSMQRVDEQQEQANTIGAIQFLMQAGPMVRMFPEMPWADIFETAGKTFGLPQLFESYNVPRAQQIGAMLMGLQMQMGQVPQGEQMPRFEGYTNTQRSPALGMGGARAGGFQGPSGGAAGQFAGALGGENRSVNAG